MAKRGEKISRSILLLLDQAVEPVEVSSLSFRVNKFSRHLFADEQKYSRPQVKRALIHLVKSGLVELSAGEKGVDFATLTEYGRKRASIYKIDTLVTRKSKHWDGKWRMIIFDIPESHRKERDAIRHRLRQLNFFKLQDSIWIYPYDCRRAIAHLADYYNLKNHLHFAIVDVFDQEDEARRFFGIRETALPYEAEHKRAHFDFHPKP